MALVEAKVDEIFEIENGIKAIKEGIAASNMVELINLPYDLIIQLKPFLKDKKIKIHHNKSDAIPEEIAELGQVCFTSVEMKGTYMGKVVEKGEIFLRNSIFNVWWDKSGIVNIGSIDFSKCARCIMDMHKNIMYLEEMDVLNIMTLYEPEDGLDAIEEAVKRSKRVRMVNLPKSIVKRLYFALQGKDVKIICAEESEEAKRAKEKFSVKVAGGLLGVYSVYKGKKANSGGIAVDEGFFSVDYIGNEILNVRSVMWKKCAECMMGYFDWGWLEARKI
jgi:hypothetical protein